MLNLRTTLREHRTDILVCLLLAASSVIYLMLRRWPLGAADEAYYFYHAIRMLEGEVLYRDVFELTTPLHIDILALAFHLFGSSFMTGRVVGSVIQALLAVAIYSGVRVVGAGRALAVAAAFVQLAIAQPRLALRDAALAGDPAGVRASDNLPESPARANWRLDRCAGSAPRAAPRNPTACGRSDRRGHDAARRSRCS